MTANVGVLTVWVQLVITACEDVEHEIQVLVGGQHVIQPVNNSRSLRCAARLMEVHGWSQQCRYSTQAT